MSTTPAVVVTTTAPARYVKDGLIAVLLSPGYGAGWSTWNSEHRDFMIFDPGLVELALRSVPVSEVEDYLSKTIGDDHGYLGGWTDITVKWVEPGTIFEITEYDGSEGFRQIDRAEWSVA